MHRYIEMIDRLAERYISTYLTADAKKIIAIDDVLMNYKGYAYSQTIPDSKLIEKIQTRFPDCKVDLERGVIHGIDWMTPTITEPKKAIAFGIKLLKWRLEDMIHLNPLYERGFSADNFARFTKESITSSGVIIQHRPIAIGEALDFLDGEFSECEKRDNKYYYKGQIHTL